MSNRRIRGACPSRNSTAFENLTDRNLIKLEGLAYDCTSSVRVERECKNDWCITVVLVEVVWVSELLVSVKGIEDAGLSNVILANENAHFSDCEFNTLQGPKVLDSDICDMGHFFNLTFKACHPLLGAPFRFCV